jgi:predicted site-specific integrase-resolvase
MAERDLHLIPIKEAADRAGRNVGTVRRWQYEGRLTKYVVGVNRIAVDADELETLLAPRAVVSSH